MTKEISLTKGYIALVDDADYEWLSHGVVYMHRVVAGASRGQEVDHINRNPLDNRRANLRIVSRAQNLVNRKVFKNNLSGVKGVYFDKQKQKWIARAQIACDSKEDAERIYQAISNLVYGEFARND
jgi:hypothetical protein